MKRLKIPEPSWCGNCLSTSGSRKWPRPLPTWKTVHGVAIRGRTLDGRGLIGSPKKLTNDELLKDVSMFDLLRAFKTVLDNMPKITTHEVWVKWV